MPDPPWRREAFFEHARLQAQKEYEADNTNTQVCVSCSLASPPTNPFSSRP
jgi:hypothetical protein